MTLPLVVAITGATGVIYGVELLRVLKSLGQPTHLILSESAGLNLSIETDVSIEEVRSLADVVYSNKDVGAAVASGSFRTRGMIVAPCTVKTLSAIANSFTYNLVVRAADVQLKEGRKLVLMVRETPLHKGHLELMAAPPTTARSSCRRCRRSTTSPGRSWIWFIRPSVRPSTR